MSDHKEQDYQTKYLAFFLFWSATRPKYDKAEHLVEIGIVVIICRGRVEY